VDARSETLRTPFSAAVATIAVPFCVRRAAIALTSRPCRPVWRTADEADEADEADWMFSCKRRYQSQLARRGGV